MIYTVFLWVFLMEELHSLIMTNALMLNVTHPKLQLFAVWFLLCFGLVLRNQIRKLFLILSETCSSDMCCIFHYRISIWKYFTAQKMKKVIKLAFSSARCKNVIKLIEDWQLFKNILKCMYMCSPSFVL